MGFFFISTSNRNTLRKGDLGSEEIPQSGTPLLLLVVEV